MARKKPMPCPCASGHNYQDCCGPFLSGTALAPTAETLMRSRYTAYALGDMAYLRSTWHSSTRPVDLGDGPEPKWVGLTILASEGGSPTEADGMVEFVARYKIKGRAFRLHERSRFAREDGAWRYVDGLLDP